jgi:hypothetical protein
MQTGAAVSLWEDRWLAVMTPVAGPSGLAGKGKFKPLLLGQIQTAADTLQQRALFAGSIYLSLRRERCG